MTDFLKKMAAASAARAATVKRRFRDAELDRPRLPLALDRFDVIAELKDSSPSAGRLASPDDDRVARAVDYARGGAAAVSVLTEPQHFAGALGHLDEVARALQAHGIPAMRKDFLVARVQVAEARAAGASGVLLIAAMLDDATLADLLSASWDHGMFVLLECFDADDLERTARLFRQPRIAARADAGLLLAGVNTRNLRTLAVDPARLAALAAHLPAGAAVVAESGLASAADAAEAAALGYRLALVGSALMRAAEPARLIRDMLEAGRARRAASSP